MPVIRLGFAVRSVNRPGLVGGTPAHLSILLTQLHDLLSYLERASIRFYRFALPRRLSSAELAECQPQIDLLAHRIRALNLRLGLHLDPQMVLGHADDRVAAETLAAIESAITLLAALDQPGAISHTLVAHAGSADPATLHRIGQRWQALSPQARQRTAIEHNSTGPSLRALLGLAARYGIPIVFDYLHFQLHNPDGWSLPLALGLCLATWPSAVRPEVHLSSQRSEAHLLAGRHGETRVLPPRAGQHADFIVARDAISLLRASRGMPSFDLMLEAKAGDLALLRLRHDLARYAPDWAERVR